jgi:hypothetical protein
VVYVQAEADVLGIEGLGTIHVRDGNQDQLKLVVHGGLLRLVGPGHFRLTAAPPVTSRDITPGHRKLIGPPMSCFKGVRELRSQLNPTIAACPAACGDRSPLWAIEGGARTPVAAEPNSRRRFVTVLRGDLEL